MPTLRIPKYRHHKGSGQAFIQVRGQREYLGKHGTAASKERYPRRLAQLLDGDGPSAPEPASAPSVALEVLNPWLDRDPTSYCFCPAEAVRIFHAKRRTRCFLPCKSGQRYRTDSYRTAIQRACRRNRIPVWSPNQLRHARATTIRQKFGIQGAQAVLGHTSPNTTAIYAERDFALAAQIMKEIG